MTRSRSDDAGNGVLESDGDDGWQQVAQRHFDPDGEAELSTAVVFAVADARGVAPVDLNEPPLYESVDVPAIEEAFFGRDASARSEDGTGAVEFRYAGYLVTVRSDGWIQVYERRASE